MKKVSEVLKMLEGDGWYIHRIRRSHRQLKHPNRSRLITVPGKLSNDIPKGTLLTVIANMKKILVVVEKAENNYAAYIPELDGCIATGFSVRDVKESLHEAVEFHLAGMKEDGLEIPEAFMEDYVFNYRMDIESFFEWFQGVLTKAGISKLTGMNQSLVSQYANGLKKPSKKQTNRIQTALHEFGEELLQIHF